VSVADVVRDYGPLAGLIGVGVTLLVNGARVERARRRETHARAIEAVVAYLQMPYAIRRRRHEEEHRSGERVRLTEAFGAVQGELANCEAVMRSDDDPLVRDGYAKLVATLRNHAGEQANLAWRSPPIESDRDIGMGDVHDALGPVREEQQRFERTAARSTQPGYRKLLRT
jgi:hypothetical protein